MLPCYCRAWYDGLGMYGIGLDMLTMGGGVCPLLVRMGHGTPKHCSVGEQPLHVCLPQRLSVYDAESGGRLCYDAWAPALATPCQTPAPPSLPLILLVQIVALQHRLWRFNHFPTQQLVACHFTVPSIPLLDALQLACMLA
jgi:hypothetical protein